MPIELINSAYELTDAVTLRKRKLTLESMAWLLVGMAIYNDKPMADIVNMLDIVDRSGKPFTLLGADGVLWRAADSKDIAEAFAKSTNRDGKEMQYPRIHKYAWYVRPLIPLREGASSRE